MLAKEKEFVFIQAQELQGKSERTGNDYHLRKIRFADPSTYENHQLDYKEGLNLGYLSKGEKVKLVLDLAAGFAGKDSRCTVVDVIPVKQ